MKNLKLSILLLILNFNFKPVFSQVSTITYELTARNLSLEAVNSYPQKLISYQKNDTLYRIVVSTFGAWEDTVKRKIVINDRYIRDKNYPTNIKKYLEPTLLTNYNHPEIQNIADSIINIKDSLTIEIIKHALKYSSERIEFDNELAQNLDKALLVQLAGIAVILGHTFPIFFNFKGGKGVATALGVVLVTNWQIGLICLVFALVLMALSRMVSLGSVGACVLFPVLVLFIKSNYIVTEGSSYLIYSIILAVIVAFNHRSNIKRLLTGTENKISFKK